MKLVEQCSHRQMKKLKTKLIPQGTKAILDRLAAQALMDQVQVLMDHQLQILAPILEVMGLNMMTMTMRTKIMIIIEEDQVVQVLMDQVDLDTQERVMRKGLILTRIRGEQPMVEVQAMDEIQSHNLLVRALPQPIHRLVQVVLVVQVAPQPLLGVGYGLMQLVNGNGQLLTLHQQRQVPTVGPEIH